MPFLNGGVQNPRRRNREKAIILTILIVYALYFLFFAGKSEGSSLVAATHNGGQSRGPHRDSHPGQASPSQKFKHVERDLVVASMKADDTTWLFDNFPEWHKSVYVVDDKNAELTVAQNKGRESMVYLTYIIDNYEHLPDVMLFIHSRRYQWHNDDPYYDGVPVLRHFQVPYLQKQGYVNLRCAWVLGCPAEIRPLVDTHREDVHAGEYFKTGFMELFPGETVPDLVGVSCCAQFGVTNWKIREKPKSDYERVRKWLAETPLKDDLSGRIMEYSWHMIFGQGPVYCPTAEECYCKVFGLCDLTCPTDGECTGRYVLPPFSSLPKGWPYVGWRGQKQDPNQGLPAP